MSSFSVRPMTASDLPSAASLLARAQSRRSSALGPGLCISAAHRDADVCLPLVEKLFHEDRSNGAVAEADGEMLGYLIGERQFHGAQDFGSVYSDPRSVAVPLHGYALTEGVDIEAVCSALYSQLSEGWVAEGLLVHTVNLFAAEPDVLTAWVNLGFGRKSVCALRQVDPAGGGDDSSELDPEGATAGSGLHIREVGLESDDLMHFFHRRLSAYQTGAPMFWPYNGEPDLAVARVRQALMETDGGFCLIAELRGEPVGMLLFAPPAFVSPLLAPRAAAYLWEAFVEPEARAAGTGSALLKRGMDALRARGTGWCVLHYVSGNPLGTRFWNRAGFAPMEFTMRRHVDARVLWGSRGEAGAGAGSGRGAGLDTEPGAGLDETAVPVK